MTQVKKEGQGRLFNSSFLELFTRTNPVIHVITYGCAVLFFLWMNHDGISETLLLAVAGVIGWTFTEYLVHRYLFHIRPGKFQYMIHGVHHEYPRDKERLMMPPLPGIVLLTVFTGIWFIVFRAHTPAYMAGFVIGYVGYTFIHYILHTWKPIPGLKFLWTHHLKHHNPAFEDKAFGVSSPLWDLLLGTMPRKSS
jgi:sterol desaturase/sphingolipid hydroxylase (fatty acid hydroxylase superfamily)